MKNNSKKPEVNASKCPVTGKAVEEGKVDSDSEEEEKPQGGCPFMGGASSKKKNPNLNLTEAGFDEPFVSKYKYYLSASKVNFGSVKKGLPQATTVREIFNTYPIYLQHTIFFNG